MKRRTGLGKLLVLAAGAAACAGTGERKNEDAVVNARALQGEYEALEVQVDTTISALKALHAAGDDDLVEAYSSFEEALDELDAQVELVLDLSQTMRQSLVESLPIWRGEKFNTMNPAIRGNDEERRKLAKERLVEIEDELDRIGDRLSAFFTSLSEVRLALASDLSSAGIAAADPLIGQVNEASVPASDDIQTIIAGLQGVQLALVGPAP